MKRVDPGSPITKKMKAAAPEAPGATEAGEDEDRISNLPDVVLGDIISLLPTKEGARTQILATRWRHLWGSSSAPLNLDCDALRSRRNGDILEGAVSSIMSAHPGPGRRFCLNERHRPYRRSDDALVDSWLSSPALDNLQHLELRHYTSSATYSWQQPPPPPPLRATAFRFAHSLQVATFGTCILPSQPPHFPNLNLLTLENASISDCSLRNMIAGCPTLKFLLLRGIYGLPCLRINSRSLKSVGVRVGWFVSFQDKEYELKEIILDNAPSLEKLLNLDALNVTVVSAPKLEILGCVSDSGKDKNRLVFGSTIIKGLRLDSMGARICALKTLAVDMASQHSVDRVIDMLKCFPSLEKLYIKFFWKEDIMYCRRTFSWPIWKPSLDIPLKLKKIVLDQYRGTYSQVNFAKFFVLNATVLESMIFGVEDEHYNKKFFARQRMALQYEERVSRGACYCFTTKQCLWHVDDFKRASDLDLTDPFVRTSRWGSSCRFV